MHEFHAFNILPQKFLENIIFPYIYKFFMKRWQIPMHLLDILTHICWKLIELHQFHYNRQTCRVMNHAKNRGVTHMNAFIWSSCIKTFLAYAAFMVETDLLSS